MKSEIDVVTGAFGFTGRYIAQRLLSIGKKVRTLTGHPDRANQFGDEVSTVAFNFDKPNELVKSLRGATTLYNTYWVRFPYGKVTFEKAIDNTKTLIKAAKEAGVKKIVHISVSNASEESPLAYFRGKGIVEKAVINSGLSYAIIRPTVIFGHGDVLINNIAWLLRRFPVFAIAGSGRYKLQPVFVEDVAELAVSCANKNVNMIVDAAGPEVYTYEELVQLIADAIRSKARIIHLAPDLVLLCGELVGYLVNDVLLTKDEVRGLMSNLLVSNNPLRCKTKLSEWLVKNADRVGVSYASELSRHYR